MKLRPLTASQRLELLSIAPGVLLGLPVGLFAVAVLVFKGLFADIYDLAPDLVVKHVLIAFQSIHMVLGAVLVAYSVVRRPENLTKRWAFAVVIGGCILEVSTVGFLWLAAEDGITGRFLFQVVFVSPMVWVGARHCWKALWRLLR